MVHTCYSGTQDYETGQSWVSSQPGLDVNFQASLGYIARSCQTKQDQVMRQRLIWPVTEVQCRSLHRRGDSIKSPWCWSSQMRNEGYTWKCSGNHCLEFFQSPQRHSGKDLVFSEIGFWSQSQPANNPSLWKSPRTANILLACLLLPLNSHLLFKWAEPGSNSHRKARRVWGGISL